MILYPEYSPTSPCEALKCPTRAHRLVVCIEGCCAFAWQRRSEEDRARREEHDRAARREAAEHEARKLRTDRGEAELMKIFVQFRKGM